MHVKVAKRKNIVNRFGARKYARVTSETDPTKFYDVVKVRNNGTRNYSYKCSCPDFMFRQKICKHIKEFKKFEHKRSLSW